MKIIYGVSGEGYGHATRAKEIIKHLQRRGHEVLVIAYGQSYEALHKDFNTHKIQGIHLQFNQKGLHLLKTIKHNLPGIKENIKNAQVRDKIIKDFNPIATQKNIRLEKDIIEKIIIFSDKDRINQVFSNLIKNAIDFVESEKGQITIGAKNKKEFIKFFVKDNGVGISEINQKEIFKTFYQIDTSTSRKRDGSGLGLAICKGIIEGLGGKIWVESKENIGTTFYFEIPKQAIKINSKK